MDVVMILAIYMPTPETLNILPFPVSKTDNLHKNGQSDLHTARYSASPHHKIEICLTQSDQCAKLTINGY